MDLLASSESRARFRARSLLTRALRRHLDGLGFLEVETPTLVPIASGAAAQPFTTHSNFVDRDLQLRIALELPLKRLLVGGLERVYEVGHVFRNEDLDSTHSPEFTMMELYWAYADYSDMRGLVEGLYGALAEEVAKLLPSRRRPGRRPERFRPPFASVDFVDELERRSGITDLLGRIPGGAAGLAHGRRGPRSRTTLPRGSSSISSSSTTSNRRSTDRRSCTIFLSRPRPSPSAIAPPRPGGTVRALRPWDRAGNAYTELNDPDEQERRFREQLCFRGEDHYAYDSDFVEALRFGMPPPPASGSASTGW